MIKRIGDDKIDQYNVYQYCFEAGKPTFFIIKRLFYENLVKFIFYINKN